MATDVEIKAAIEGFRKGTDKIRANMEADAQSSFSSWLTSTLSLFRATRLHGPPGVNYKTGNLFRSFYTTIEPQGKGMEQVGVIGSRGARQAKVLEYGTGYLPGGAIKPKHSTPHGGTPMLAIPIKDGPAMTAGGRFRFGAQSLRQTLPSLYPDHDFWVHEVGGKLFLMGDAKGDDHPVPWFQLVYEVRFGPKLGLRKFIKKEMKKLLGGIKKKWSKTTRG